ncbi:hypothetical protein CIB48_g7925 [Xylaria polymorpha]|nr:hypothetical protein CIB48_g7925 [Xylaria polymorpha]
MEVDISDSEECFEVREAEGKGLGCFATRDIKPGETVLVSYTSIIDYDSNSWDVKIDSLIDLYESLHISDKREWADLHGYYEPGLVEIYKSRLARQRPNGRILTEEEQEEFLHLFLAFDNNAFETEAAIREASVVYPEASRFNHSVSNPQSRLFLAAARSVHIRSRILAGKVVYECNTYPDRWVGRANRHIATGEELTIGYMAGHSPRRERQASTMTGWGFVCMCPKCSGGLDTYTASLEQARDIANGVDGSVAKPIAYGDDIESMANQLHTRVNLLRDIVPAANPEDKKWRARELAMALWEASIFHRRWRDYWIDDSDYGGNNREEGLEHSKLDFQYADESVEVAKEAWSRNHEMYQCLKREAKKGKDVWDSFMAEEGNV